MSYNVHPYPLFTSRWDGAAGRSVWEQNGFSPGMSVKQLYLAHILGGLASNPATMLNIEEHLDYAIKLADIAVAKSSGIL